MGYTDSNTGIVKGYSNLQTITVESENPIYIVGEDGALYNDVKSKLFLYPAQNPATHFDVPITVGSIRPGAFCDAKNLQSVSFHSTLNNLWISQHAFANASSLSYISFASETTPAQYYVSSFIGLPREGVVVAPTETDDFKSFTKNIVGSHWTFCASSTGVVSYLSSDGTLYVAGNGEYTTSSSNASWYSQRSSIKKIVVKEGVTYVGTSAFEGCTALTTVTLPSSVTSIGQSAFSGCSALTTVNVASLASFLKIVNLFYLTDSFYGTAKEKTLMVNGITHSSSSELVIPEGVTEIPKDAFRYFKNVTKIKLPESMKTISSSNFYGHTYLKEIILPSTVTSVGESAFNGCTNLELVICRATKCPSVTSSIATNPGNITLKVPRGKASLYKAADIWKEFNISEPIYKVEDESIFYYGSLLSGGYVIANLNSDYKVKSWTSTNTNIAVVASSTDYSARICAKDYVYDGTTAKPYKGFAIKADLGDYDSCVWKIKLYPREVVLKDGNEYKNTIQFPTAKISYTRNFPEKIIGKWQCFYVPFDIEVTDELLQNFDFAKLYMVSYQDANDNGEIEEGEPLKMILNKLSAGKVLHANMPYYVRTKSSGEKTFESTNIRLMNAENGTVRCSTTEHEYTLTGIYGPTNIMGFYTMGTSGGFSYYTKDKTLNQYRWYMEIRSLTEYGAEYDNYARPIEIFVDGEDDTTGIVALQNNASAPKNDKIYTLDGRQVTDYDNLPSGIYIINGKKVFKK